MFAVRKNLASTTALVAVCLCIAWNCYLNLGPNSFGRTVLENLRDPNAFQLLKNVDQLYAEMPAGQNALLKFKNFQIENEAFVEMIYYRSNYAAYPGKVFTAAPGTVLNRGRDILQSQFAPSEEWLDRHRVGGIIVFERTADGEIIATATARDLK